MSFDISGKYTSLGGYASGDWGKGYALVHSKEMDKIASKTYTPEELLAVADKLRPREDGRYVLLHALGTLEAWGANANGDGFNKWSLLGQDAPKDVQDYVDQKVRSKYPTIAMPEKGRYGHRTFTTDAHVFKYHENTDPLKSIGNVIASAFNDPMQRVELIVFVNRTKEPELVRRLDDGEPVPWSMGAKLNFDTCLYPDMQVNTPSGFTAAKDIQLGDLVLTDKGRARKVTRLFKRQHSGKVVTFKVRGSPEPLKVTDNHPVLVIRADTMRGCRGTVNGGRKRRHTFTDNICSTCGVSFSELPSEYVEAGSIKIGDYTAVPRVKLDGEGLHEDEAKLCGYYLGDGHIMTRRSRRTGEAVYGGIAITCNNSEPDHTAAVKATIEALTDSPVHVYDAGDGKQAKTVMVNDQILATRIVGLCGRKKDKHLPAEIFASSLEAQKELLSGLVDTDGHIDPKKKSVRFCNTNKIVALQAQLLATSIGIPSTLSGHESHSSYADTYVYQLNLGTKGGVVLAQTSTKCANVPFAERWSNTCVDTATQMWLPVDEVVHDIVENQTVYNFSVEEDETYLVNNITVHNCSVCHNAAKSRAEYCDHLRYSLNQILPDGRKVFSYNYFPRFFDISWVRQPADRSAWTLRKIASEDGKLGEIKKQIPLDLQAILAKAKARGNAPAVPVDEEAVKMAHNIKDRVVSALDRVSLLDPITITKLAAYSPSDVANTLAYAGVFLLESEIAKLGWADVPIASTYPSPHVGVLQAIAPEVARRSFLDPHFSRRRAVIPDDLEFGKIGSYTNHNGYRSFLQNLDFAALEKTAKMNAAVRYTIDVNPIMDCFTQNERDAKLRWLPFLTAVSCL